MSSVNSIESGSAQRRANERSAGSRSLGRRGFGIRQAVAAAALIACVPFLAMLPEASANAAAKPAARPVSMVRIAAVPQVPNRDHALGAVGATSTQSGYVVLKPRNEAALKSFIAAVTNKRSSEFHDYLAAGAFAQRFGPTNATISAVTHELTSEGLHVSGVSRDGLLVHFSARASTVEAAFRTGLERYRLPDGSTGEATTAAVRVPSTIARSVEAVVGLDDLIHAQPADIEPSKAAEKDFPKAKAPKFSHPTGSPTPCAEATSDAVASGGLTDDEIANAYGAFGLYRDGDFGSGQHVALYELQPFLATDIEAFDTCYFGATEAAAMSGTDGTYQGSRLNVIGVDGGILQAVGNTGGENDEANLDIEDVSALVPEANIDVYEAPNTTSGGIDEYSDIVNSDTDDIVSSSWAECEQLTQTAEPGLQQTENFLFQQAAAQGQTVLSAAGDTGDDECNEYRDTEPPAGQNLLSQLDPGSQPYVVSVGGTSITDATQPPTEQVWNDGAEWGAGGGGPSETWQMPSWQQTVADTATNSTDISNAEALETQTAAYSAPYTTPTFCDGTLGLPDGTPCRETPDVTAQADEFTGSVTIYGAYLGYGFSDGWATIGGTSSATPIWASMLALSDASTTCSSETVNGIADSGFASPLLYSIAANPTAYAASFNDITTGNNDVYGLDNGLVFPAHTGYDMASGLGSPELTTPSGGNALAFYLCNYADQISPPSVTALSPQTGSTVGDYTVTVTGSGFGTHADPSVASVQVGTVQATAVSVTNDTTLTATFPPAADTTAAASVNPTEDGAGPVEVSVTGTNGATSVPSSASIFEYVDETSGDTPAVVPSVTGVGPYAGLETGPSSVRIYGSGFASSGPNAVTSVSFGGVDASTFTVTSPFEITVTPPDYSAANTTCSPLPDAAPYLGENATNDICQVEVVVSNANGSSATSPILPPYEGSLTDINSSGGLVLPSGCGCEDLAQPSEFDYLPAPTITSVSTGTIADLANCGVTTAAGPAASCNAADLADEFGGSAANVVTITGTGMNDLTLNYATIGLLPFSEVDITYPVAATGTTLQLVAPAYLGGDENPTSGPQALDVGFTSIAGPSTTGDIVYAGAPNVTAVVNPSESAPNNDGVPAVQNCTDSTAPTGCGTAIDITGTGLEQSSGPIGFVDNFTGTSLGLQYNYDVTSDTAITTQVIQQNPGVVDVEVCSNTTCSYDPPNDFLFVYPPGNPSISSLSPTSGPASGGNTVTINGSNLGCAEEVIFGDVPTIDVSNTEALLTCGSTAQLEVEAPPGKQGSTVQVTVVTAESIFAPSGTASNTLSYTYKTSPPSPPQSVDASAGAGTVSLHWSAPAENGGSSVTGYALSASSPGYPNVDVTTPASATSYTFSDLQAGAPWTLTIAAVSAKGTGLPVTSAAVTPALGEDGYLVAGGDGAVAGFGDITGRGGIDGSGAKVAGIAATPDGLGYFVVSTTGAVTPFGDAAFQGQATTSNVTGIAATPDGGGYWIVTKSGKVYPFGDASTFHGGKLPKGADVTGIAGTPDGGGYWLVTSKGAVVAYGDAGKFGSASKPKSSVVAIAAAPNGSGYWLVDQTGQVFAEGSAKSYTPGSFKPSGSITGIAAAPNGKGYWLVGSNGKVYNFGSAKNVGNASSAIGIAV